MKKHSKFLLATAAALTFSLQVFAQAPAPAPAPMPAGAARDVYVSRNGVSPNPLFTGTRRASADEGRRIQVDMYDLEGPITVDPMQFVLVGPPCPTYDAQGRRTPAVPLPNNTADFVGNVRLDMPNIPAAGTTTIARFKAKDNGFWTVCSSGQQRPEPQVAIATLNIHSIEMVMADANINLCGDQPHQARVTSRFPANKGTVTYASANGRFTLINPTNSGVTMKGNQNGADELVATFTVEGATWVERIPVSINFVKFTSRQTVFAWYAGGTTNANDLLDPLVNQADITWTMSAGNATINANTGVITFPAAPGKTYTVTATSIADNNCKTITRVVFMGYTITVAGRRSASFCDGTQNIRVSIRPLPASLPVAELNKFQNFVLTSVEKDVPTGNEEGATALTVGALDANFNAVVTKAIWYQINNGCNTSSGHTFSATANVNGVAVNSPLPGQSDPTLYSDISSCLNGRAYVTQAWTGLPRIGFRRSPILANSYRAYISGAGNFRRDVKAAAEWWGPPASQFMAKLIQEENFHKNQQLERANHPLMADLYDPRRVLASSGGLWWDHPNPAVAQARVMQGFLSLCAAEVMRSQSFFGNGMPRRCAIEREAKQNTGIQFGFMMRCAYQACP